MLTGHKHQVGKKEGIKQRECSFVLQVRHIPYPTHIPLLLHVRNAHDSILIAFIRIPISYSVSIGPYIKKQKWRGKGGVEEYTYLSAQRPLPHKSLYTIPIYRSSEQQQYRSHTTNTSLSFSVLLNLSLFLPLLLTLPSMSPVSQVSNYKAISCIGNIL